MAIWVSAILAIFPFHPADLGISRQLLGPAKMGLSYGTRQTALVWHHKCLPLHYYQPVSLTGKTSLRPSSTVCTMCAPYAEERHCCGCALQLSRLSHPTSIQRIPPYIPQRRSPYHHRLCSNTRPRRPGRQHDPLQLHCAVRPDP